MGPASLITRYWMQIVTDHSKLVPALAILTAVSALALPVQVQAMPSAPAVAAPRDASVLEVANQRRPYQNVNRRNDRGNNTGDAQTEQLNQQSLQRAQQGQSSPTPGPDTTSNLNRMSDDRAARGQNTSRAPMPFR